MSGLQLFELLSEITSDFAHVIEKFIEDPQRLDRYRASQWSSTKRAAVHAGMHTAGHAIGHENRAQRQSRGKGFGNRNNVGLHAIVLVGKIISRAPQATLNLVKDQQRAIALRQLPCEQQEFRAHRTDSTFTLNCLQADCTNSRVELGSQILNIVKSNEANSRQQGNERIAIFRLTGGRQRTKRASMKRIVEGEDAPLRFVAIGARSFGINPSQFQSALPRLCSAVAEKSAI